MDKIFAFLIVTLFVSPIIILSLVSANDFSDRKTLVMDVSISNDFTIKEKSSDAYVQSINVTLQTYPRNSERQDIFSNTLQPDGFIGDDSIDFYWKTTSQRDFKIFVGSEVRTQYKVWHITDKVPFPIYNVNASLTEYVKPTDIIDISPEIRDVSASLSQESSDLFEVEYLFAEYVRKNIQYDLGSLTADVTQKSSWVLNNKVGVCDELTNLFISLNRAAGIPARFVSGYAYTELDAFKTNWVPHAWAEVYFPEYGWVSYDVTYGQYGFLDSGHVKMLDSNDGKTAAVKYDYIGRDISLEPGELTTDISVIRSGAPMTAEYTFNTDLYDSSVGFGSYNLIEVSVNNPNGYYLVADLYLANNDGIDILEDSTEKVLGRVIHRKQVLMGPYESKKIYWLIKLNNEMSKGYFYTYPILVYNSLNQTRRMSMTSREDYNIISKEFLQEISKPENSGAEYNQYVTFRCEAPESAFLNEIVTINCVIDNKADRLFVTKICFMQQCKEKRLEIQVAAISFNSTMSQIGMNNLIIKMSADGLEKTSFVNIEVKDRPRVIITNVEYPERVGFNERFMINFDVDKTSYTNPENVTIKILGPTLRSEWNIEELTGERRFVLNTDGRSLKPKDNTFKIMVEYNDGLENFTEEKDVIITSNANFFENIVLYFNQVAFWLENI
jgi:transglutaminase-like putative cysteine protease